MMSEYITHIATKDWDDACREDLTEALRSAGLDKVITLCNLTRGDYSNNGMNNMWYHPLTKATNRRNRPSSYVMCTACELMAFAEKAEAEGACADNG